MADVPVFSSRYFTWTKGKGYSNMGMLGLGDYAPFPKVFDVRSDRTGAVKRFEIDQEVMIDNDFFDGEASAYCSADDIRVNVWTAR